MAGVAIEKTDFYIWVVQIQPAIAECDCYVRQHALLQSMRA